MSQEKEMTLHLKQMNENYAFIRLVKEKVVMIDASNLK